MLNSKSYKSCRFLTFVGTRVPTSKVLPTVFGHLLSLYNAVFAFCFKAFP